MYGVQMYFMYGVWNVIGLSAQKVWQINVLP